MDKVKSPIVITFLALLVITYTLVLNFVLSERLISRFESALRSAVKDAISASAATSTAATTANAPARDDGAVREAPVVQEPEPPLQVDVKDFVSTARPYQIRLIEGSNSVTTTESASKTTIDFIVFEDFQCPYCSKLFEVVDALPEKGKTFIEGGTVRLVHRHFPVLSGSNKFAQIVECAGLVAGAQAYYRAMYEIYQTPKAEIKVENLINTVAGDVADVAERMNTCIQDESSDLYRTAKANIQMDSTLAKEKLRASGTPTSILDGDVIPGFLEDEILYPLIEEKIKAKRGS